MKIAKKHPLEDRRMQALNSTKLLDSLSEDEYDSITYLASQICQTPIALISLVDSDRQWFKSKVGLDASETSRDFAFCAHAILGDEIFVVEDSTQDERFFDNPLVQGDPKVIFYAGAPLLDPDSKLPLGTVCIIDHKSRKLTEEQRKSLLGLSKQATSLIALRQKIATLEEQKKKLKRSTIAIENMQEGFVLQDRSGAIVESNPAAQKILGLTEDQLNGKSSMDPSWHSIKETGEPFPGNEHPAMIALSSGQIQTGIKMGVRSTHFKERWISINASPIFSDEEKKPESVVVTFVDNTELQQTQAKLMDNARLVSLAEMASGIAHEINNPLAIINGLCSVISKSLSESSIDKSSILNTTGKIKETVFRISRIVKGLQAFSRSGDQEKNQPLNLSEVISDVLSLCSEKFKFNSVVVSTYVPDGIWALGNTGRLGQVILNLLTNSYDAIREKQDKWIQISVENVGGAVKIVLKDSGNGIPTPISKKMFHPFYTTKEVGMGTGLGLSLSKGFIEEMDGRLYYDSTETNTTFVIELKKANDKSNQEAG